MIRFGQLVLPTAILPSARLRVLMTYLWSHGRLPNLAAPRRFTEWVQWRKLNDRDPDLALLTDKEHGKQVAAHLLGANAVPATAFLGTELPVEPPCAFPLIVKSNHGSSQFRVVRTRADWDAARAAAPGWLGLYGAWLDEWHYRAARPAILVEPMLGGEGAELPVDYKVYVFGGRAHVVQAHVARGRHHRWTQFGRDWTPLSDDPVPLSAPHRLDEMLDAAERLAGARDFLRVDFYEVGGQLWFGEFCLFPGSGLDPFVPDALDEELGALWAAARAPVAPPVPVAPLPAAA